MSKCGLYRKSMNFRAINGIKSIDEDKDIKIISKHEEIQELRPGARFLDGSQAKEATLEYVDISQKDISGLFNK